MSKVEIYRSKAKDVFRTEGLSSTIKYFNDILSPSGSVYDDFVMLSAEYVDIDRRILLGVLTEESTQISLAKLRGRVMYLINSMTYEDISIDVNQESKGSEIKSEVSEIDLEEIYQLKDFNLDVSACIADLDDASSTFEFLYEKSAPFFAKEIGATKKIINQLKSFYSKRKVNNILLKKWTRNYSIEMKSYSKNLNLFSEEIKSAFHEFVRLHLILLQANYAKDGHIPSEKIIEIKELYSEMRTTLRESKVVVRRKIDEFQMLVDALQSFGGTENIQGAIRAIEKFTNSFDKLVLYAFQFEEGLDMIRIKYKND